PVLEAPSTANTRQSPMSDANLGITERKSLVATRNPQGFVSDGIGGPDDQIFVYEVQWGDTAQSIANSYGITVNTLLWANDLSNPNRIKVGSRLVILPVTGFTYDIKKGDTIDKIVKKYGKI
ncbi:MAG: Lipoprotein, partial [Candidatus Yanofskybacteria bacterium GW2011_GWA1_41_6]